MKKLGWLTTDERIEAAREILRHEIRNLIKRYGFGRTGTALHDVNHEFRLAQAEAGDSTNEYSGTGQGVL